MHQHHKSSLLPVGNQHRRRGMPQKYLLFGLMVICFTILLFTGMVRASLCELQVRQRNIELVAFLAGEIKR